MVGHPNTKLHTGRCVSDRYDKFEGCDEAQYLDPSKAKYTVVFGPDQEDSPCTDTYTNQARNMPLTFP